MPPQDSLRTVTCRIWLLHALYFVIGGIWSVVARRSFEAISGPKTDYWLVRTVGGLLTAVGGVIGVAGMRNRITAEIAGLAVASSAVLTVIDVVYTARRRISPVYLLDAIANVLLIGVWFSFVRRGIPGTDR